MNIENLKLNLKYYLEELDDLERSQKTIKNYNENIILFINFLIKNDIKNLNQDNINDLLKKYRSYLKNERNNKSSTRVRYLQEIILFLEKLNFKIDIKLPKNNHKNKKIKYLTLEEIQTVMDSIPKSKIRDKTIFQVLYRTGIRVSELSNLQKTDLDLKSAEKAVTVNIISGKGNKDRLVYIDQPTLKLINTMIYKRQRKGITDKTNYLFINKYGNQLTTRSIQQLIKNYAINTDERLSKQGIETNYRDKLTPHTLRHSFTVYLLNDAEKPINTVQKLLGHSNLATTSIYSEIGNKQVKKSYESIEWN